jgi:hypothetical protein
VAAAVSVSGGPEAAAWSVLGFDGDPLPGDPRVLQGVVDDFAFLRDTAWSVCQGLDAFLASASSGGFEGATADALRGVVSGRLKTFVHNVARAFSLAGEAVAEYRLALVQAQQTTAGVLARAYGVAHGDPRSAELRRQVCDQQARAADAAALMIRALEDAAHMVSQPIKVPSLSGKVWKGVETALNAAAMVLAVLSMVVDGPLGLAAAGAAAGSFAMTLTDYARGRTNLLGLGLSVIGLLMPTTKGIWSLEELGAGFRGVLAGLGNAGAKSASVLSSPTALAQFLVRGGVPTWQALTRVPGLLVDGLRAVPGLLRQIPEALGAWGKVVGEDFADVRTRYPGLARVLSPHGTYTVVVLGRAAGALFTPMRLEDMATLGFGGAWKAAWARAGSWRYAARDFGAGWTAKDRQVMYAAVDVWHMLRNWHDFTTTKPKAKPVPELMAPGPVRWSGRGPASGGLVEPVLNPVAIVAERDLRERDLGDEFTRSGNGLYVPGSGPGLERPSSSTPRTVLAKVERDGEDGLLTTRAGLLVRFESVLNAQDGQLVRENPQTLGKAVGGQFQSPVGNGVTERPVEPGKIPIIQPVIPSARETLDLLRGPTSRTETVQPGPLTGVPPALTYHQQQPEPASRDTVLSAGSPAGSVTLAELFAREDRSAVDSPESEIPEPVQAAVVMAQAAALEVSAETERDWSVDRDVLGEVSVVQVDRMHPGMAAQWANRIAYEAERLGDSEQLRAAIRDGIRRLLTAEVEPSSSPAGTAHRATDAERALGHLEKTLQQGHLTVADGHVVWLRPVLRDLAPSPAGKPKPEPDDVVAYKVGYAKLVSSVTSESATSSGFGSTLQTLVATSSLAASTVAPVLPILGSDLSRLHGAEVERDMTVGRRLFDTAYARLQGGIHVRVFVDGAERPHNVVTGKRVTVDVPAGPAGWNLPRLGEMDPSTSAKVMGEGLHHAREVINAIDLIPVTAAFQRHLLQAGLPAHGVREVMSHVLPRLNERSARNRSRYWLTNGVVSERVRFRAGSAKWFEGHVFLRARFERLQYLGDTPGAVVREDTSGSTTIGHLQGARQRAVAGLAFFSTAIHRHAAFLPTASLTIGSRSDTRHGLSESAENHTVLTATSDQARYRVQLRLTVQVRSATHRIAPFSHLIGAEIGVPARESADFERRLLGGEAPALRQAPPVVDGPAQAPPRVGNLLSRADVVLPGSAYRRPARLDQPLPAPHPREPLALATRRGQGFGVHMALPGSELVHDQVRGALERWHNWLSGNATADWSRTDHDLLAWFGRPALESDLSRLLSGVDHTIRLGGRSYEVSVRAHLLDRIGGVTGEDTYRMKVNVRSQQTAKVSGRYDTRWNAALSGGLSVQLRARSWLLTQLGTIGGRAGAGQEVRHTFSGGSRSYQRTQAAGPVDEHVYDVVYEIQVRTAGHPAERWWLERPGDVVARVAVPHQHVPTTPVSAGELSTAGTVSRPAALPGGPVADFRGGGTAGVFPAFLSIPQLRETAARMYQQANGLPADWLMDQANWPTELKAATDPVHLGAELAALTGKAGKTIQLPVGADGWKQALRLQITAHQPRHVAAHTGTGRTVEIQHYVQGQAYLKRIKRSIREAGLQAALGPVFQIGHGQLSGAPAWNATQAQGHEDKNAVHAQILAAGTAEVRWEWMKGTSSEQGPVGNSRASYRGTAHTYRADPVFEITLHRWKGAGLGSPSGMTHRTEYLQVTAGMDFLVPEQRICDLGLPLPDGAEHNQPYEPTGYVHPAMLPVVSHPELLHADAVLDRMKQWLTDQGILHVSHATGKGADDSAEHRPNLLLRELERSFSCEALLNQFTMLTGAGVTRWLPLPWAFGATRYLWTNVKAQIHPATSQRKRPEVRLMTRAQAHLETARHKIDYRSVAFGGQSRARIGTWAHAGLELGAGYTCTTGKGTEWVEREMEIDRAITEEASEEFTHPVTFHIRMGITTEPPEVLSAPVSGVRAVVFALADRLGQGRQAADWWYRHQPFAKQFPTPQRPDDGIVHGRVRLLVPGHLVVDGTPPHPPAPATPPGWEPSAPSPHTPRSSADEELLGRLLRDGHPWALPAAAAINRWAALTAAGFRPPHDLTAPDAWRVPGLDPTTPNGLRYAHMTSENLLRANIGRLLRHQYQVPVGDRTATVGVDITAIKPLGPQDGSTFTARHHKLTEEASKGTFEQTRGWYVEAGPEAGAEFGKRVSALEQAPFTRGMERTEEWTGETAEVEEPDQERSRRYRHYSADVDLIITGPRGRLRVHVPDGLYFMLPGD